MALEVGAPAPEISLFNNERQVLNLENFKGQTSVLVFFPGAFTGGCQEEACTFRDSLAQYEGLGAQVYGISVDSFFVQNAFISSNELNFPFLSDYSRKTIESFGIAVRNFAGMEGYTTSQRAVVVLDKDGVVRFVTAVAPTEQPDFAEIQKAVTAI
ncbi:MAG: peroxiredoxin [Chloroflexi bacterium]|nr:peroxiredoxin [Chloroflexota bacterium]|tara:strand:+ start:187 stop:654 length:468 start_codon:yes stop_codon:yes gene_type:complete